MRNALQCLLILAELSLQGCIARSTGHVNNQLDPAPEILELATAQKLEQMNIPSAVACKANEFVIGVSQDMAILCVNDGRPLRESKKAPTELLVYEDPKIQSPRFAATGFDWAKKRMKLECPLGYYSSGLINAAKTDSLGNRWPKLGIFCAKATLRKLESNPAQDCNTVWFDGKKDQRPSADGSLRDMDFDVSSVKGQCARGQYLAGLAYYDSLFFQRHEPHALLCCSMQN